MKGVEAVVEAVVEAIGAVESGIAIWVDEGEGERLEESLKKDELP